MDPRAYERIVERGLIQHGVVHRDQVLAEGISRHALAHLVESGRWQRVLPSICAISSAELTDWGWIAAASLCLGHRGLVARSSAAAAMGLVPWPSRTEVVVLMGGRLEHPRIKVHRTRELLLNDGYLVRGVRMTSPLRTLLDLGRDLDPVSLGDLLAGMIRTRRLSKAALAKRLATMPQDPFTAELRSMVSVDGTALAGVEVVLARALREAGFAVRMNQPQPMPGGGFRRPDVILHEVRVVVQVESKRFHSGVRGPADVARDRDWLTKGYLTIRVDARRIRTDLAAVVAEIVLAVRAR